MNNSWMKIICYIVIFFLSVLSFDAIANEDLAKTTDISPNQDYNIDSDSDGLSDLRERWWLCDPMNKDTNADGILDGDSVNFFSDNKTWPYLNINKNNDTDGDGLPNLAEKFDIGTDFKSFSTDGDPYGDGEEYFNINMPKISPADHPLVAAFPDLSVRLTQITVKPIETIESSTGGSNQTAWSLEYETSNSSMSSDEAGVAVTVSAETKVGGVDTGVTVKGEISGHYTHVWEKTHVATNSKSKSGWDQNDWSTAHTSNTAEAAKLGFTLNVKNDGTIPAEDVIPDVNIKLGKKIIATVTSPTKISSIGIDDSSNDFLIDQGAVGNDITASLEQLRFIDAGTPLNIETLQIRANMKRWDGDKNEWVSMDRDVNTYMNEIDRISATLMFDLNNGTYKQYKVFAGSDHAPMTLGNAINLTIKRDEVLQQINEYLDFGFSEEEAFNEFRELIDKNESIYNLKLRPGWKVIIKAQRDKLGPRIVWTGYSRDMKTVYASITNDLTLKSVVAHVNIVGTYQDLNMTDYDEDMVYVLQSGQALERDENNYIIVTDIENAKMKSLIPKSSSADSSKSLSTPNQVWHKDSRGIEGWACEGFNFGDSFASGDFNADGIDDLAISQLFGAEITIIHGSVNGLEANNAISKLVPTDSNPEAGARHLVAGDFDGDGIDDLTMITSHYTIDQNRYSYHKIRYETQNFIGLLSLGEPPIYISDVAVGDLNNDRIDDLIVGYYNWSGKKPTPGFKIFAMDPKEGDLLDKPLSLSEEHNFVESKLQSEKINFAVADFDCDGKDDIAVGLPDSDIDIGGNMSWWEREFMVTDQETDEVGIVAIYYSSSVSEDLPYHYELWQKDRIGLAMIPHDKFGLLLAGGDFNGDGIDDLAVAANESVSILFGSVRGITNNSQLLQSIKPGSLAAGDLNNDGIEELVVGEPELDQVKIFKGTTKGITSDFEILSQESLGLNETSEGDSFGSSLIIGDFNNDGFNDIAVGAPKKDIHIGPGKTVRSRLSDFGTWSDPKIVADAGAVYVMYSKRGLGAS